MKDILVYLNGNPEDEARIVAAELLASANDGHVTGLVTCPLPEFVAAAEGGFAGSQVIVEMQRQATEEGNADEAAARARFERLSVLNEVRRIDVYASQMGAALASEARAADIFVATRPYGTGADTQAVETVLFESGRGSFLVPPGYKARPIETVLIAWHSSKEAARAVAEAMPLLKAAKQVILCMVSGGESPEQDGREPGADMARHLNRHGVEVEIRHITGWSDPGEAILNETGKAAADLIVMGGYGHSRFREWILGGVTRDILSSAEVPVLLAH